MLLRRHLSMAVALVLALNFTTSRIVRAESGPTASSR